MYIELQPEKTPRSKKKKWKRCASKREEAESFVTKQLKNFVRLLLLLLFGDITRARQFVFDLKFARFFFIFDEFKFQDLKWL